MMKIKITEPSHTKGILEIYAPFIEHSHTSFEYRVPTEKEMQSRISETLKFYPWIVAESDEGILGYAYASLFRYRKAYDWACETSVYIHPNAKRKGVATQLYRTLIFILKAQGIHQCIAGVALPNDSSIQFHEKLGYSYAGIFKKVGYKEERWVDVAFWQLEICDLLPKKVPIPWHTLSENKLRDCGLSFA